MDIMQLTSTLSAAVVAVVAVVGAIIVGLLAIVPTLLEIPRDHDVPNDPGVPAPTPLLPRRRPRSTSPPSQRMAA